MKKNNKAQPLLTYVLLIAVVAAGLVAMRLFFVRALQEKYRQSADVFGQGEQYEKAGVTTETWSSNASIVPPEPINQCSDIRNRVATLQDQINSESIQADSLIESARKLEHEAQRQRTFGFGLTREAVDALEANAADLRRQAEHLGNDMQEKSAQIELYRHDFEQCFDN